MPLNQKVPNCRKSPDELLAKWIYLLTCRVVECIAVGFKTSMSKLNLVVSETRHFKIKVNTHSAKSTSRHNDGGEDG